jgi:hypothetical protein
MRAGRLVPLGDLATAGLVALVAFLPFARGALTGQAFYFRDFSTSYLPLRLFALTGLREGEFRYWNPYAHEGVPMPYPPVSYPLELFGLLAPGERGFSLLLALHVPLAGIAFLVLARGFGLSRLASAAGAIVYALGGFCLSSLNLYFYLEAMAWAPLVLLSLVRAAEGRRWAMAAALTTAVMVATLGAEVVLQTAVIAVVLAAGRGGGRRLLRLAASAVLGAGLAAPTVCVMRAVVAASARGAGFHPSVVLAHSVHPFTLLQVVVGGLYGDLSNLPNRWWGQNFFPRGFPYVLSLYLGATVLSLAWIGARRGGTLATRLALLSVVAVVVCLGRWAGLQALVEALPVRAFRYPTKAFFTVHIAVALLAARGLDALYRSRDRVVAWRQLAIAALGLGTALVLGPRAFAATAFAQPFQSAFFPPAMPWPQRLENFRFIVDDATRGGLIALAAGTVALVYLAQRIGDRVACPVLVALVAADLLRAGAGLNPMVTSSFFRLSEEMRREAELFHSRGRIFTCDVNRSPAYWRARAERAADHDVWSFAVLIETLTPNLNTGQRVRTAFSEDLTSLVPIDAVPPSDASCFEFGAVADRLRAGAVTDVISLDPLTDPRLRLRAVAAPARIAPLTVGIYELADPLPLRSMADLVRPASDAPPAPEIAAVAGGPAAREAAAAVRRIIEVKESSDRIDFTVETDRPAAVVMRETWAEGWTASVNGLAAAVSRADGRYRAVEVPAGRSRVVLRYRPPGLRAGLALAALSIAILVAIPLWARRGMKG